MDEETQKSHEMPKLSKLDALKNMGVDTSSPIKQRENWPVNGVEATVNGMPYHIHPTATLQMWQAYLDAIEESPDSFIIEPYTPPPAPTTEEIQQALESAATNAVANHINTVLSTRQYEPNGSTIGMYATLTDEQINNAGDAGEAMAMFRAECQALQVWIPSVWAVVANIKMGLIEQPESIEALINLLPQMQWPDGSVAR